MSKQQIKHTARLLLLLYIGYFGGVSYFVHSHVYQGVTYIHSHPYAKWAKKSASKSEQPPYEAHHHTSANLFTFNQLSNITSGESKFEITEKIELTVIAIIDKEKKAQLTSIFFNGNLTHRGPPTIS